MGARQLRRPLTAGRFRRNASQVMTRCPLTLFLALATTMLSTAAATFAAESPFTTPPQRKIEELHHARGGEWYVTSDGQRHLVRVGSVGPTGLADLTRAGRDAVPPAMGWEGIARIESRSTRRVVGGITGAAIGAVALGFAGAAIGEAASTNTSTFNDQGAFLGIVTGVAVGGWAGSAIGGRHERVQTLYVGTSTAGAGSGPPAIQPPASGLEQTQTYQDRLLRVRGSFGSFVGRAKTVAPEGLSGLEPDPARDSGLPLPQEPIAWSQISSVERLGTHAGRGAVIGALVMGGLTAMLAAAASQGGVGPNSGGSERDAAAAAAVGAVVGGGVGALLGAVIGSSINAWHPVYRGAR